MCHQAALSLSITIINFFFFFNFYLGSYVIISIDLYSLMVLNLDIA